MSDLDVVHVPGYPGMWARRVVVRMWIAAGSPPLNWAGRTYEQQKYMYDLWRQGRGNAADNPDANTRQPHVRGMALDLQRWDNSTVQRMGRAGFTRPIWRRNGFSQDEPWHFEPADYVGHIRSIPKVTAAQVASLDSTPFEEDDMTPEQSRQLNAIFEAVFVGGSSMKDGGRSISASLADIALNVSPINRDGVKVSLRQEVADSKTLALELTAQVAALTNVVEQITSGTAQVDMGAVVKAAAEGAREALGNLTLTATVED